MSKLELIDTLKSNLVEKLVFRNEEKQVMEVLFIRKGDGKDNICLPSQTSCKMGCKFCHLTGMNVPVVNLSSETIVSLINASLRLSPPQNKTVLFSFMGAGEPLVNANNLIDAMSLLKFNYLYENKRFAISTLIPSEKAFNVFLDGVKKNNLHVKLHWSLHFTDEEMRHNMMPGALDIKSSVPLINKYLEDYPVEIHYTLIDNVNDAEEDAVALSKLLDKRCIVKLLRFASNENQPILSESKRVVDFKDHLASFGYNVEIYSPPGRDIGASCGQFLLDKYTK